jgi:hypothetical protein
VKLKAAITRGEQLDALTIGQENECVLGKWLAGEGRSQFSARPEFQKLVASHQAFHAMAARAAAAVNAGKPADAEKILNGQFRAQSLETVAAIQACKKACN